jgi:phosphohistidine phosphatase
MKTVFLIRHAKSDKGNQDIRDIDRYLNARGYSDAYRMSKFLKEKDLIPAQLISSPAIRAFTTALIFSDALGFSADEIELESALYEQGYKQYIETIKRADDTFISIALFGHNPDICEAAEYLNGKIREFPTCAVAVFVFNVKKWSDIGKNGAEKAEIYLPGDLKE